MNRKLLAALTAALTLVATLPIFAGAATDDGESTLPLTAFNDTNGHIFENAITWLAAEGITTGCNPPANTLFCPNQEVTRGQMAIFLSRALNLAAPLQDHFIDDNGAFYEGAANRLRESGITVGCNPPVNNRFCGDDPVTRQEMATFIVRGFKVGPTNQEFFIDDDTSVHEGNINRIRAANITVGCNPPANNRFCPRDPVTRGQMAAFMKRAVESLGVPTPPIPTTTTTTNPGSTTTTTMATTTTTMMPTTTTTVDPNLCLSGQTIPQSECQALVTFYNSTGGAGWLVKTNWLTGNACNWYGVGCSGSNVTSIQFPDNGLTGSLPATLGTDFPMLQTLSIDANEGLQTSSIPSSIANHSSLVTIELLNIGLEGTIPALGSMPNLEVIDLQGNELEGTIPALGGLTSLVVLDLSNNNLDGVLPADIATLENLEDIVVPGNFLDGPLPDLTALGDTLIDLDLDDNQFGGPATNIPAFVWALTSLEFLDLSDNGFTGQLNAGVGNLTGLVYLDLSQNALTGPIPSTIGNLTLLEILQLSANNLAPSEVPAEFLNLAPAPTGVGELTSLDMCDNGVFTFANVDVQNFVAGLDPLHSSVCP